MTLTIRRRLTELERGIAPAATAYRRLTAAEAEARVAELLDRVDAQTPAERLAEIRETLAAPVPTDLTGEWIHRMWLDGLPEELAEIEKLLGKSGLAAREMERVRDAGSVG